MHFHVQNIRERRVKHFFTREKIREWLKLRQFGSEPNNFNVEAEILVLLYRLIDHESIMTGLNNNLSRMAISSNSEKRSSRTTILYYYYFLIFILFS